MKRLFLQIALVAALILPVRAEPTWNEIEQEVLKLAPQPEWLVVKELDSLTLIRKGCRLMGNISPPLVSGSETEIMQEYGFDSDFVIKIRREPKISDERYAEAFRLRETLRQSFMKELGDGGLKGTAERRAANLIRLPDFRLGSESVFVEQTRDGCVWTQPKSVGEVRDKVLELLKTNCGTYPKQQR